MFKKLIIAMLAIGSSYAIEPIKDVENKDVNSITQQMNSITLDNIQNNVNNVDNTQSFDIQAVSSSHAIGPNKNLEINSIKQNIDEFKDTNHIKQPNNEQKNLFDIQKLLMTKHYRKMTKDEIDWAALGAYDMFSTACQKFWQKVMLEKQVTDEIKNVLYRARGFRHCIMSGINPVDVIFDELKYNIDESCLTEFENYMPQNKIEILKNDLLIRVEATAIQLIDLLKIHNELDTDDPIFVMKIYLKRVHQRHKDAGETDEKFHDKFHCSICNPSNMQCPICPVFETTTP